MHELIHEVVIHATPERVYEALTSEKDISSWWLKDARTRPKTGYIMKLGFNERKISFRFRIEALEHAKQVTLRCLGDIDEWTDTVIIFKLKVSSGRSTTLRLEHIGWKRSDGLFGQSNYSWGFHLRNLKWFLETGEALAR
jgi:uncharacterized protein YndB with AHSA1/START domain